MKIQPKISSFVANKHCHSNIDCYKNFHLSTDFLQMVGESHSAHVRQGCNTNLLSRQETASNNCCLATVKEPVAWLGIPLVEA